MDELISSAAPEDKGDGIRTTVAFSRKRADKSAYADYHEKIWAYVRLIWHEAQCVDANCDPRSDKRIPAVVHAQERAFQYPDMATTRAGIGAATAKLTVNRIALVGLGGTGSYILDLLAKTPVAEIHIFDGDKFSLHNAFRGPGAPARSDLTGPKKVDWFGDIYDRMHRGITRHPYHVDAARVSELVGFDFVFVAVDGGGGARKVIIDALISMNIPFIDVGIDLDLDGTSSLRGMCRVTLGTPTRNQHVAEVVSFAERAPDEVYRNIQVADLNMLNAALAVLKWKKTLGFYADDLGEHHSLYTTATHSLVKDFVAREQED